MTDTLTFKELLHDVTGDANSDEARLLARQIQHWISAGLLDLVGLDLLKQRVGRGKVRRYPAETAKWCRLLSSISRRGMDMSDMVLVMSELGFRLKDRKFMQAIRAALDGKGWDVLLLIELLDGSRGAVQIMDERASLPRWQVGFWINLSVAFRQVQA